MKKCKSMKLVNHYSKFNLLVVFLLVLKLASTFHIFQHANIGESIHCDICVAINLDADVAPLNTATLAPVFFLHSLVKRIVLQQVDAVVLQNYAIRAPPVL